MEKIKVNMSPNPLDVQTIHASQNDGEARQWEFELHNNGELIDTSEVTEQLFFKSYKGGTEKLLPENTSTPTTSPFKGDIRYPQGLLTDQEFTYRQSPTEEDGNAKITDIKGNTLVWNQLVQNGNFAENVAWNGFGGTYSYADNVATLTVTSASATQGISAVRTRVQAPANHILLLKLDIKSDNANALFGVSLNTNSLNTNNVFSSKHASTSWETWSAIITPTVNVEGMRIATYIGGLLNVGEKFYLRNVNLIDLTAMFGTGNEPSTVEEFTSLFPLSYYSYNQGSLLSFNGTGIRTTNADGTAEHADNLPTLTYFPTGMKSAGSVYDELTESKAITRLKKVTYSSSTGWATRTTGSGWILYETFPSDIKNVGTSQAETIKSNTFEWNTNLSSNNTIRQINTTITVRKDDITSLADWETYLASNPLEVIYELATPTETSFTTASLVTENAEIPLSNDDGVLIGKCTEQLSENPGFIDAKIKLTDSDGECYSNKLQLHVERSPQ